MSNNKKNGKSKSDQDYEYVGTPDYLRRYLRKIADGRPISDTEKKLLQKLMKGQGWEKVSRKNRLYITLKKQSRQRKSGDKQLGMKRGGKVKKYAHGGKVRSYNFIN